MRNFPIGINNIFIEKTEEEEEAEEEPRSE
jgi:hypothetical protein